MAKAKKTQSENLNETEMNVNNQSIDLEMSVDMTTEKTIDDQEVVNVVSDVKEENKLFTMDITEYGVKFEDAEKFIKTAIKFYFENKDKKLVNESELEELKNKEVGTGSYEQVLDKVKKFEDQIKMNQFVPKKNILDFTKSLKS